MKKDVVMVVSLEDIVEQLRRMGNLHRQGAKVEALLRKSTVDAAALAPYVRYQDGAYTRNYVYRDAAFEMLVLAWAAGSRSPIHDHGGNRCWLVPQSGAFTIDDYVRVEGGHHPGRVRLERCGAGALEIGQLDARGFDEIHDIHAVSVDRASISLHVYAAPIAGYLVYDWERNACEAHRFGAGA